MLTIKVNQKWKGSPLKGYSQVIATYLAEPSEQWIIRGWKKL